MMADPHSLIEGCIITCYAIRAQFCAIYIRGEALHPLRRVRYAVERGVRRRATSAGTSSAPGSTWTSSCTPAPAPTSAARRRRCWTRWRAAAGSRGSSRRSRPRRASTPRPTVVNNVETIASVPAIVQGGSSWFRSMGREKSPGPKIYSLSGHVTRPGQYEAPMGTTLRELLELAGGMKDGIPLKFWTPGGSSTPLFTAEHMDVPLDFEGAAAAGSMLGTTALQIFNETVSVPWAVMKWTEFYKHECCGKCTPCREGTYWLVQILRADAAPRGHARRTSRRCSTSATTSSAARSARSVTAPTSPITSGIKYFRPGVPGPVHRAARRSHQSGPAARTDRSVGMTTSLEKPDVRPVPEGHVRLTIDGEERRRAQGRADHPHLRAARHHRSAVLRPPAARPGGRVPPVPGRGRDGRPADAQAAGQLHDDGRRRHGRQDPALLAGGREGAGGRDGAAAASTTRSTARSATRAASARCRTRR